jgi:hypothetical protein
MGSAETGFKGVTSPAARGSASAAASAVSPSAAIAKHFNSLSHGQACA